ncbi:MAG: hypothetical protein A2099_05915 [Planctomycetes bacterium GWF2_39_10]|nr:MAG: hypothetical protein A2099_05915 [Planctomycetes bacterium GWF2_39_10]
MTPLAFLKNAIRNNYSATNEHEFTQIWIREKNKGEKGKWTIFGENRLNIKFSFLSFSLNYF